MSKTFKDMASVMGANNRDFAYAYWQGKGHAIGERRPRSVIHPARRQMTLTEAIREADTYDSLKLAWAQRR